MQRGRPSLYSDKIADVIVERIIEGQSLRSICSDEKMPNRATVLRWLDGNEIFAAKYARAREFQGDYMDDLILEAAEQTDEDNAVAQRVKIDAYKWRAAKLQPKRYGDKLDLTSAGEKLGLSSEIEAARQRVAKGE
jgi:hypothetical protein